MIAYEYETEIMQNGLIEIPSDIRKKIKKNQKIKILIMIDENQKKSRKKLGTLLINSPLKDSGIDLERKKDFGRNIEL